MSKWFYGLVAAVICFIGSLVTWYYKAIWLPGFTDYPAAYGQMGDFFGGLLNPVLAFASFMALLHTIRIQSEELRLTREELTKSSDAQHRSADSQNKQLSLQKNLKEFSSVESLFIKYHSESDRLYQLEFGEKETLEKTFNDLISRHLRHNPGSTIDALKLREEIYFHTSPAHDAIAHSYYNNALNAKFQFEKLVMISSKMDDDFKLLLESYAESLSTQLLFAGILSPARPLFMPDEVEPNYLSEPLSRVYVVFSIKLPTNTDPDKSI